MKHSAPDKWERIASRVRCETAPVADGAPFGFSTRMVAKWREMRRDEALRRWSFWSLRAALCSVVVCGFVVVLTSRDNDSSILITPPSADFISLPLSHP